MIIAPGMIYTAMQQKPPEWLRAGMIIAGVGTLVYNLQNFLTVQKQETQIERERLMRSQVAEPTVEDLFGS